MAGTSIALSAGGTTAAKSSLQRGKLKLFVAKHPDKGGGAERGGDHGEIGFQFNPKEMSIAKSAKWEGGTAAKAAKASPPQFTGSEPCKLTLELFFDATKTLDAVDGAKPPDGSVVDRVEKLFGCLVRLPDEPDSWPPLVQLEWGAVTSFLGYVQQVQAKYTLFAANGTPLRATCSITIQEMPETKPKHNPTSGTYAVHSEHTMLSGENLAGIAYREYGDPALWRPLAAFNEIDDPLRVRPGTTLIVPELSDLLAAAGRDADRELVPTGGT
jgi:nucleoid-associated protein YgaU